MFRTLKSHALANKTFIAAVIISLFLHTLALSELSFTLPVIDKNSQLLKIRLAPATEPPVNTPAQPVDKANPQPLLEEIESSATDIEKPSPNIEVPTENEAHVPIVNDKNFPTSSKESEAVNAEYNDAAVEPPSSQNNVTASPTQFIETEFEVLSGEEKMLAGYARITFNVESTGSYLIKSTTEGQGVAAIFFKNLVQESQGYLTENGLKPSNYAYHYGSKKSQIANFQWVEGTLLMRTDKAEKTEKLENGTQDLLSFMYQFMYIPPQESTTIYVTNGKSLRHYIYHFEGEEIIYSKFGALNTIRLIKNEENSAEKTELWLATDYKNLPVKIRKTEKNGSVIEQVVIKITTSPPLSTEKAVSW